MKPRRWTNPDARVLELDTGTWELLGSDRPVAREADGRVWYWCCLARSDRGPMHSGSVPLPPLTASIDELRPHLREVVERSRAMRKGTFLAMEV